VHTFVRGSFTPLVHHSCRGKGAGGGLPRRTGGEGWSYTKQHLHPRDCELPNPAPRCYPTPLADWSDCRIARGTAEPWIPACSGFQDPTYAHRVRRDVNVRRLPRAIHESAGLPVDAVHSCDQSRRSVGEQTAAAGTRIIAERSRRRAVSQE